MGVIYKLKEQWQVVWHVGDLEKIRKNIILFKDGMGKSNGKLFGKLRTWENFKKKYNFICETE